VGRGRSPFLPQTTLAVKKILLFALLGTCFAACNKVDVLEKNVAIRNHSWPSGLKPEVSFTIEDTASLYNVYLVIRHFDAYNYNNIWVKCTVTSPGDSVTRSRQYNLTLATNEQGWLGTGMDDIFEIRTLIQPGTKFTKAGEYKFVLEQVMREDPLDHILNVGLRVEKAGQ
jgi:gliding motility-associated lipoprotein GldH